MHGRESRGSVHAELDARQERVVAAEALATFGELAGRHGLEHPALAGEEARERLGQGGLHVAGALGVVLEDDQGPGFVSRNLRRRELRGGHGGDALLHEVLVQERQEDHPFPVVALTLKVHLEVLREKLRERGMRRGHQPSVRLREQRGALRGLHREQLLKRAKGNAVVENARQRAHARRQVRRHRGVVERVVPGPGGDSAVVVLEDPVQALEVRLPELGQGRGLANLELELFAIVHLLPRLDAAAALLEHRAFRRGHHGRVRGDALGFGRGRVGTGGGVRAKYLGVLPRSHERRHGGGELIVHAHLVLTGGLLTAAFAFELGALSLLALHVGGALGENVSLESAHHLQDSLQPAGHEGPPAPIAGDVPAERGEQVAVRLEQRVQRALRDVQRGQRGQEIVPHEHAQQHEIVHDSLAVVPERQGVRHRPELLVQVLPQQPHVQQEESVVGGVLQHLATRLASFAAAELDNLAEQAKVRLVGDEREHDEVGVEAVEAVGLVRVPPGFAARPADVLHDLVLALAPDLVAGEDHGGLLPQRILRLLLLDVEPQVLGEAGHERGAGGDAVGVERLAFGLGFALRERLGAHLLSLPRALEAAGTLLVHLGARGDAVDRHVEQAPGADHAEDVIQVREHLGHLRADEAGRITVSVRRGRERAGKERRHAEGTIRGDRRAPSHPRSCACWRRSRRRASSCGSLRSCPSTGYR